MLAYVVLPLLIGYFHAFPCYAVMIAGHIRHRMILAGSLISSLDMRKIVQIGPIHAHEYISCKLLTATVPFDRTTPRTPEPVMLLSTMGSISVTPNPT
jgi:hypothetical protein